MTAGRRLRWGLLLGIGIPVLLLALGALGVWGFFSGKVEVPIADDQAKEQVVLRIQEAVGGALDIEPSTVIVELGEAPILPQVARQELDEVSVTVPIPAAQAVQLLGGRLGLPADALRLRDGGIALATTLDLLVTKAEIGIDFTVAASDGSVTAEPDAFFLNGAELAVADILAVPVVGDWVRPLLEPKAVCVAALLPRDLVLTEVEVTTSVVTLTIAGQGVSITPAALAARGACGA